MPSYHCRIIAWLVRDGRPLLTKIICIHIRKAFHKWSADLDFCIFEWSGVTDSACDMTSGNGDDDVHCLSRQSKFHVSLVKCSACYTSLYAHRTVTFWSRNCKLTGWMADEWQIWLSDRVYVHLWLDLSVYKQKPGVRFPILCEVPGSLALSSQSVFISYYQSLMRIFKAAIKRKFVAYLTTIDTPDA